MPDLPDPTAYCQSFGAKYPVQGDTEGSKFATNECLRQIQDGYETAKALWPQLSDYSARYCTRMVTQTVGGTPLRPDQLSPWGYAQLGNCALQMHYEWDLPREPQPPFHKD
jgi:hypothetical protein